MGSCPFIISTFILVHFLGRSLSANYMSNFIMKLFKKINGCGSCSSQASSPWLTHIKNHFENKALHRELEKRKQELAMANYKRIKLKLMQFFYDLEYQTSGLLLTTRQLNALSDAHIFQLLREKRINEMFEVQNV